MNKKLTVNSTAIRLANAHACLVHVMRSAKTTTRASSMRGVLSDCFTLLQRDVLPSRSAITLQNPINNKPSTCNYKHNKSNIKCNKISPFHSILQPLQVILVVILNNLFRCCRLLPRRAPTRRLDGSASSSAGSPFRPRRSLLPQRRRPPSAKT